MDCGERASTFFSLTSILCESPLHLVQGEQIFCTHVQFFFQHFLINWKKQTKNPTPVHRVIYASGKPNFEGFARSDLNGKGSVLRQCKIQVPGQIFQIRPISCIAISFRKFYSLAYYPFYIIKRLSAGVGGLSIVNGKNNSNVSYEVMRSQ